MTTWTPSGPEEASSPGRGDVALSVDPAEAGVGRPRRRLTLWICLAATVVVAALLAVLASSPPANEILLNSPLLGKQAPPINGTVVLNGPPGGGPVELSAYRGKWVLVNFAASWCVPCQKEMPQLLLFAGQHRAAADATILTVVYDEGEIGNLRRFLQQRSVSWPAVDQPAAKIDYGVNGLPESYLIDPRGTMVAVIEGQANAGNLDSLIAKYTPSASGGS